MAKFNVPNYLSADGFGLPLNIRRGNPNPLDNSEVWTSLEDALNYAAYDPTAYVGQEIAVVDIEKGVATRYVIQDEKGTLKPTGSEVLGDNFSVEVVDGKVTLVGFSGAEVGAQPRKKADGTIEWIKPDTTTVDGLNTAVEGLQNDVQSLADTVGNSESGLVKDVTDIKDRLDAVEGETDTLEPRVTTLEGQMAATEAMVADNAAVIAILTGSGEGSVKKTAEDAATAAVNEFATNISDDGIVNSFKELVDYVADHDGSAAQMAADILTHSDAIAELQSKVGERAVSDQIAEAIEALQIGDYAKASDLVTALARIDAVEVLTGDMQDTLEGKVDKVDGHRLMTDEEGAKLAGIADGAEANVIAGVSGEFAVSGDRILSIVSLGQDKVVGLPEALEGKVDAVEGKGLSTNDFTTTLLDKLNGIADGAEANVIEKVTFAGQEVAIVDKTINIPAASNTILGMVMGSDEENKVSIDGDNTMEVYSLNVNRLVQTRGDFLILNGGNSSLEAQ